MLGEGAVVMVLEELDSADTKAIRAFNRVFLSHPQLDATIIPLGDGTGIGARLDE